MVHVFLARLYLIASLYGVLICKKLQDILLWYCMTLIGKIFLAGKLKKLQLVKIDQNRLLCLTPAIGGWVTWLGRGGKGKFLVNVHCGEYKFFGKTEKNVLSSLLWITYYKVGWKTNFKFAGDKISLVPWLTVQPLWLKIILHADCWYFAWLVGVKQGQTSVGLSVFWLFS